MKAKKEISQFLIICVSTVLLFTVVFGEKPIYDFIHIGGGLLVILAVSAFLEYRERKKIQTKKRN